VSSRSSRPPGGGARRQMHAGAPGSRAIRAGQSDGDGAAIAATRSPPSWWLPSAGRSRLGLGAETSA
jgi:hypothetical protein